MLELADAVIVGGGVIGISVAEALGRRYSKVLLIEADRCGNRATTGGFGWVNASAKWDSSAYHLLNAEACRRHVALAAEWDSAQTGWNGGGSLAWSSASDRAGHLALERRIEALQALDYPAARVSRGEMQALEPHVRFEEDAVGLFAPSEGWVSAPRLMRFFMDRARAAGVEVAQYTRATGFGVDFRGAIANVVTTQGPVSTRTLVLCAGVETGRVIGLLPLYSSFPADRVVTASPGMLAHTAVLPADARVHRVCYPAGPAGLHMRPTPEGGLLIGADDTDALCGETRPADSAAAAGDSAAGGERLVERATSVLPRLDRAVEVTTRCCVRAIPADGLPLAGELPGVAGAYMLVTHSGITLAPLLSQLLAEEIITGRPSSWLSPYRPDRLLRPQSV